MKIMYCARQIRLNARNDDDEDDEEENDCRCMRRTQKR